MLQGVRKDESLERQNHEMKGDWKARVEIWRSSP